MAVGGAGANGPEAGADGGEIDPALDDLAEEPSLGLGHIISSVLRNPVVHRALIGIAIALVILAWPQRSDRILARAVGLGLILLYSSAVWDSMRRRPRDRSGIALSLLAIAVGLVLLAMPGGSEDFLGRALGTVVAFRALGRIANGGVRERPLPVLAPNVALLAAAALLIAFPSESIAAVTTAVALGWIAFSVVVIAISIDAESDGETDSPTGFGDATELMSHWLRNRSKSLEDRESIIAKVLFDGADAKRRYVRFFTLMSSAAVIASMGVITDSTAVVIGAMLIAPLMTPLMGMAMSLVMGWPRRLTLSAVIALGGIAVAIGIGLLLGLFLPAVIDPETNSQILSRSSPTILDLVVALAAGTAGAYALSRPDVSDSLPGVAIAISLVPPLAVVGISYSQGAFAIGNGALLLFATNMVAILIMGGATFIITGVTPLQRVAEQQHRMQTSLSAVAALAAVVIGALFLNGATIASNALVQSQVETGVEDWLEEHPRYELSAVRFEDELVVVTISGPADGDPTAQSLADALADHLNRPVDVSLRHVVVETSRAESE